jgi:7-carboxy-7-deazaguanine synthase
VIPVERAATGTLRVAEVFGPTIQGEGPASGRAAAFLRLGGCNLSCSWCDTPYTWDATRYDLAAELTVRPVADIAAATIAAAGPARAVVLTGGEPLYQQGPDLYDLLKRVREQDLAVHVETNGTIAPTDRMLDLVTTWVVSPKLGNAGQHRGRQTAALNLAWGVAALVADVHLKVVCANTEDVTAAAELAERAGLPPHRVWVMPEGTTPAALAQRWPSLCDEAARRGFNASHRLHVLAWGDERGH